jgi:hypothetical protein
VDEEYHKLVLVTQKHAAAVVAYSLTQITGYVGREPPLVIELDTNMTIFQPP